MIARGRIAIAGACLARALPVFLLERPQLRIALHASRCARSLRSDEPSARLRALQEFGKEGVEARHRAAVVLPALQDPSLPVRKQAATTLREIHTGRTRWSCLPPGPYDDLFPPAPAVAHALHAALSDNDPTVRFEAAMLLFRTRAPDSARAIDVLFEAFASDDPNHRWEAARALGLSPRRPDVGMAFRRQDGTLRAAFLSEIRNLAKANPALRPWVRDWPIGDEPSTIEPDGPGSVGGSVRD